MVNEYKSTQSKVKESKVKESIYAQNELEFDTKTDYFDTFWKEYPRKESKDKARQWFKKINLTKNCLKK